MTSNDACKHMKCNEYITLRLWSLGSNKAALVHVLSSEPSVQIEEAM